MKNERRTNLHFSRASGLLGALVAVCGIGLLSSPARGAKPLFRTYCIPSTSQAGPVFLAEWQTNATSTDSATIALRDSIMLPAATLSSILVVSDEAKCSRASRAVDSVHIGVPINSPLLLVQVGTHYMALPPSPNGLYVHMNSTFTVLNFMSQQ